jgi:eukaryotic-like serine/threonine-protein kinase
MPEPQTAFSDRYELVKHIARGGMAQVYLARDLLLDRPVALKVLFPELSVDRSFVERFRREAKAAANLSHPNIVSVYDWGQGENTYFIVMEYIDGRTLSSVLKDGPIAPDRAAAIGASVAAALDFAHRRGVIHRDVKPGNVLIDERGQVKVADFGIARAAGASEDLTQTGSVMGTATYFSPEQAQGFPVDARSDVYSLGVVLYEMATGKPPFAGDNPVSIAYKHVKETAPSPSLVNPGVPADFEAIINKAMAKDPAARYQSADDLRADLARFGSGQPVVAAAEATSVMPAAMAGVAGAAAFGGAAPTRVQPAAGGGGTTAVLSTTAGGPPGPPVPPPEESRAWMWVLLALLLLALGVGIFFLGRAAGWWGNSVKTVTVPTNLVNKPQATAQTELTQLGFTNIKSQQRADANITTGNVITTDPPGGTKMKSNAPITLVVSTGATQITVPNVVGQPANNAALAIQKAGFVPTQSTATSNTVAAGNVISTDPAGGQKAPQGSVVKIVVSSGKQMVTIPSLVGQSPATAGQQLGAEQLIVNSAQEASSSIPAGQVTRTNPPAGASVPVGSTVTVYVSTGPPQVHVPNVIGKTQAEAQSILSNAGLQPSFTTQAVSDPNQNGKVQSESPVPGTSVDQGSTVNAVIGTYQSPSTTTSTSTPPPTTSPGG